MQGLSSNELAFIRPTPSSGSLGGVAKKTRETILLCEAAGYEIILIETVGVGQSETAVHSMVDFFLLLMIAGAGDELQGIKRGIMEMADGIVINKADGDNIINAKKAQSQYQSALHLFPPTDSAWIPKVLHCSSLDKSNIDVVWDMINNFQNHMQKRGLIIQKRKSQNRYWLHEMIKEALSQRFYKNHQEQIHNLEKEVINAKITPSQALKKLLP
jgi:LAO/AO transport system kinase